MTVQANAPVTAVTPNADNRLFRFDSKTPQRCVGAAALLLVSSTLFAILWPLRYSLLAAWFVIELIFYIFYWRPRCDSGDSSSCMQEHSARPSVVNCMFVTIVSAANTTPTPFPALYMACSYNELNRQPPKHEPVAVDGERLFQRFLQFCKDMPQGVDYKVRCHHSAFARARRYGCAAGKSSCGLDYACAWPTQLPPISTTQGYFSLWFKGVPFADVKRGAHCASLRGWGGWVWRGGGAACHCCNAVTVYLLCNSSAGAAPVIPSSRIPSHPCAQRRRTHIHTLSFNTQRTPRSLWHMDFGTAPESAWPSSASGRCRHE